MIANIIWKDSFLSALDYLDEVNWKQIKEVFGNDLKEIELEVTIKAIDGQESKEAVFEHLSSLGWSDEEMINAFLKRKEGNWWLQYDEKLDGFELYEVLK